MTEKINASYVLRVLRLTLRAPDIVEAILDGRQPEGVTLPVLMDPFPVEWASQRSLVTIQRSIEQASMTAPGAARTRSAHP